MSKEVKTRIVHKHDLEKNWDLASNFIPKQGEIIIYDIENDAADLPEGRTELITYERIKVGDGATIVKALPFVGDCINMELITVDDIDTICGTTIQVATASEVTF